MLLQRSSFADVFVLNIFLDIREKNMVMEF